MLIKQLSVFLENKPGRLGAVIDALSGNAIDIRALSLADTSEYGILRIIVSDTDKAASILRENGVVVKITDVLAVPMDNAPGGLSRILRIFSESGVNVEYMYAFVGKTASKALMVVKVSDTAAAGKALEKSGIVTGEAKNIYQI